MATDARKGTNAAKRRPAGMSRQSGGKARPGATPRQEARPKRLIGGAEIIGEVALIAMILSVPIVINVDSRNICDIKDLVLGLGVAVGLALWLFASLMRGRIAWASSRLNAAVFAFAAWAFLSLVFSHYRYVTISEWGRLAANLGVFVLAIASVRSLGQVRRLLAATAVVAVAVCIYGFYQAAGKDFVNWAAPVTRVFSFMGNPTYLGGFLMLVIPLMLAAAWPQSASDRGADPARARWRYVVAGAFVVTALMGVLCLYYSVTLSAAIGLGLGLGLAAVVGLVLAVLRGGRAVVRATIPKAVLVAAVLAGIARLGYMNLPPDQQNRVRTVMHFRDPYASERQLHWKTALDIFHEHPLVGSGYGAFRVIALPRMAPEWYMQDPSRADMMLMPGYAHNEYLQVLADLGIVGGVLFGLILVGAYGLAVWVAVRHPSRGWSVFALAITAAMTAFLFQNFFGVTFRQTGAVTFFWLWLALLVVAKASMPRGDEEAGGLRLREWNFRRVSGPELLGVGVVLVVALLLLTRASVRPVQASLLLRQAQGTAIQEHYQKAAELADEVTALCPYSSIGYYVSAYCWGQVGNYDKAIEGNKKALELAPGNASMYYNLGVSYKEKKQYDDALKSFLLAIKLMPTNYRNQAAVAETYLTQGKAKEAEPYARKAAELGPNDPKAHLLLADVLNREGKLKDMIAELEQADKDSPNTVSIKRQLAQFLYAARDYDRGLVVCKEWVALDPGSASAQNALGTYYFGMKRIAEAKGAFVLALQLDPNHARARLNLGFALGRLKEVAAAREQLLYVTQHFPGTPEALEAQRVLNGIKLVAVTKPK